MNKFLRFRAAVGAGALLIAGLAGCGGGGGSLPPAALTSSPVTAQKASPGQVYVALGDSITYGSDLPNRLTQAYPFLVNPGAIDLGIAGSTVPNAQIYELPKVPSNATLVTLFFGTDDLYAGETSAQYITDMQALIAGIRQEAPSARLVLIGVPHYPPQFTWAPGAPNYNSALTTLGLPIVDLYDDAVYTSDLVTAATGEHPSPVGQAEIARLIVALGA